MWPPSPGKPSGKLTADEAEKFHVEAQERWRKGDQRERLARRLIQKLRGEEAENDRQREEA